MKKMLKLMAATLILGFSAMASATNTPIDLNENYGQANVNQCVSNLGNCNNPDLTVNFNGDVDKVYVNGKVTTIKGADGKDGLNGADGKDGATGAQGEQGLTGADGKDGRDGVDGVNGKDGATGAQGEQGLKGDDGLNGKDGVGKDGVNGKDADMTVVNNKLDKTSYVAAEQKQAADLDLRIAESKAAQAATNKSVAANTAKLVNHEQRISSLEQQTSAAFGDLKRQIDDNKKDANAGISGVAAMANIPQVTDKQDFSVGAGVGARGSEQAVAVGFSGRMNENWVVKASVATDTQSGWTVGAGAAYGW